MPKIIFTSRYLRDAPPAKLENYVRYIGTREGVEKVEGSRQNLPATRQQKNRISQIVRDIPAAKEMLEYTDFLLRPTLGNASEFISCAVEQNLDLIGKRGNYVDYIANRPRVERIGEHGLFTDAGKTVVLRQVQEEAANHKGPIWTHVISLRREDAARLGYDSAEQWMALLRSKRAMLCRHMKIDSSNLRWYAAFHNEGHHPHVHLMVYSAKDNDGYLTGQSIEAMRSELAHDIFRQDFAQIYEAQDRARADLKSGTADVLRERMEALRSGTLASAEIEKMMVRLAGRLRNTGGKKVYGYLKRDVKDLVDRIVDELAKDEKVDALYQAWGKRREEILMTYQNSAPPLPPLSGQPQFKSLKNMVIAEAVKLGSGHFLFEDEAWEEDPESRNSHWEDERFLEIQPDDEDPHEAAEDETPEILQREKEQKKNQADHGGRVKLRTEWSNEYKLAGRYLYGTKDTPQDLEAAFSLFMKEAESGNVLAMYDLGRIYADGLGREADSDAAQEWYARALKSFQALEADAGKRKRPYLQYRIGKMYAAGLGTAQDYEQAARWLEAAAETGHMYARYSLAGMYRRGQGVVQDDSLAFKLYKLSAQQGNPYAVYELAKLYRDGIGAAQDDVQAQDCFRDAFLGFSGLEEKSGDDRLRYRIGWMLHTGTGTERDDTAAAFYWEQAAKAGNLHAQYALGKLWLEAGNSDTAQAVLWIRKAAETGNPAAQYTLAKLYLSGDDIPKNVEEAMRWLEQSAGHGNQYAQYALGKLYLCGQDIPRDRERAVSYLQASAEQGNIYAAFLLEHMNDIQDPSVSLAATRLLHRLEKLFREDIRRTAGEGSMHIDRKRRRRLAEKKQAQGHKRDDREPVQHL